MPSGTALLITPERLPDPAAVVMGLARRDLTVVWATSAAEALQQAPAETPQVVLLDLAIGGTAAADPGGVGAQLCQKLRFLTQAPILLTGAPQDKPAILRALGLGADAFLFKPVPPDLLVAALAALSRRPVLEQDELPAVLEVRDLEVDRERCEARLRGEPVPLTPTEFRILGCLARNLGRVVSARQLLQEAQGYPCTEREAQQIVKVHIRHLRTKLEPPPGERSYIANVRGFGYLLERRTSLRPDDLVASLEEPDTGE
jgi:DNA-binding response OmpR family regulator